VAKPGEDSVKVPQNEISPGFLPTLGIPILEGRDFVNGEQQGAIINQALAGRLWPSQRAVGQELWVDRQLYRVIGIAADVHALQPGEAAYPYLYLPIWGRDAKDPRLFVRTHGGAGPMLEQLRREVVSVDPEVHVGQVSTLAGRADMSYQRERLLASLLQFTTIVAVLLSAVGIYGFISYQVVRRTREIAIRIAPGGRNERGHSLDHATRTHRHGRGFRRWRFAGMVLCADAERTSVRCWTNRCVDICDGGCGGCSGHRRYERWLSAGATRIAH
jgi:hypothetical protein